MARDLHPTRYGLEFVAKVLHSGPLTPSCHGIRVERPPEFAFKPVQFTFLSLRTPDEPGWEDYRSMSLASSPARNHLEYGVRMSDSAWKKAFQALRPGDEVMVEGPVGHFVLHEDRPAVFVAGGIGITPLKGMIEYAVDKGLPFPLRLIYSNRDEGEIAYRTELEDMAAQSPRFEIEHTLTREPAESAWKGRRGRVDADLLRHAARGLQEPVFYVCGAPGMVAAVQALLAEQGVPTDRILFEEFWGY